MIDTHILFNGRTLKRWSYKDHWLPSRRFNIYTPTFAVYETYGLGDEVEDNVSLDIETGFHWNRNRDIGAWSLKIRFLGFGFGYSYQETY